MPLAHALGYFTHSLITGQRLIPVSFTNVPSAHKKTRQLISQTDGLLRCRCFGTVDRLAINTIACRGCLECGRFTREFEFWTLREVLNVILKVIGTWQRLASDTRLASCRRKGGHNGGPAKQQAQSSGFDSRKH